MEETAGRGVRNDRLIWKRQQGTAGCEEWQVIWSDRAYGAAGHMERRDTYKNKPLMMTEFRMPSRLGDLAASCMT